MTTETYSLLFTKSVSVRRFTTERLPLLASFVRSTPTSDYIWDKFLAAEADAQRELHVFFVPTVLFPNDPTQDEIDALDGAAWAVDPGYDYDQDITQPGGWSYLALRQKPVISLESIKFSYPSMGTIFSVPPQWIKVDKKYGHVRFIPTSSAFTTPMGGMMIAAMGMQSAPQFIEVRYTAGLKNAAADYPDLLDLIQRMVMLRMVTDAFLPGSSSISADGLSQSMSPPDLEKMQAAIDKSLETLRTRIHGIPLMVL